MVNIERSQSPAGSSQHDIWADDRLERSKDAALLMQFLLTRIDEYREAGKVGSYVLNLDAGWGQGKTYFLTRLEKQLVHDGHPAIYINAWEDDHAADPLVPVLQALDTYYAANNPKTSKLGKLWKATKKDALSVVASGAGAAMKAFTRKYAGDLLEDVSEATSDAVEGALKEGVEASVSRLIDRYSESLIKDFQKAKGSIQSFKEGLRSVTITGKGHLFILIDELDRCRPNYAIALLERIKHLFAVDGIIFVIATNTEQLRHAVTAVYGGEFDGRRYLHRFFDRTYCFAEPSHRSFVEELFTTSPINEAQCSAPNVKPADLFLGFMKIYDLSLRDAEQCFDMLRTVVTMWGSRKSKIEIVALMPFIIAHQQGAAELWQATKIGDYKSISTLVKHRGAMPIKFIVRDDAFNPQTREISLLELSMDFIESASTPLPKIVEKRGEGTRGWITERYREEFQVVHGNRYLSADPPYSIVLEYGELVRCAGRLAKSTGP